MPRMLALLGSAGSHLHGLAHVAPLLQEAFKKIECHENGAEEPGGDTDLIAGLHLRLLPLKVSLPPMPGSSRSWTAGGP